MRGQFQLRDTDKLEATMTLTATLHEWKELSKQLQKGWPSCDLSSIIFDTVNKAEAVFHSDET